MKAENSFFRLLGSRWVITTICAIVIWGLIIFAISVGSQELVAVIGIGCAILGWKALTRIQPSMFLWMSWAGWVVYFFIKFILAIIIGYFITPFYIGKAIGEKIHESIQE